KFRSPTRPYALPMQRDRSEKPLICFDCRLRATPQVAALRRGRKVDKQREVNVTTIDNTSSMPLSRRHLLRSAALTGAGLGAVSFGGFNFIASAFADDKPPIGTWPDGSSGSTVNIGAAVPRTGTYAVQGEDELKGWQLAVEHINSGDPLLKKIAPKVSKG